MQEITSRLVLHPDEIEDYDDEAPSPYMVRQAVRAEQTGLSPMEELKIAQGELAAKTAVHHIDEKQMEKSRLMHTIRRKIVPLTMMRIQSTRNRVNEAEIQKITQDLAHDLDNMTARTYYIYIYIYIYIYRICL